MMLENEEMMMVVDLDVFVTSVWKMMRPTVLQKLKRVPTTYIEGSYTWGHKHSVLQKLKSMFLGNILFAAIFVAIYFPI